MAHNKLPCSEVGKGERGNEFDSIIKSAIEEMIATKSGVNAAVLNIRNPVELRKAIRGLPIPILEQLRDALLKDEEFRAVEIVSQELINRSTKSDPSV